MAISNELSDTDENLIQKIYFTNGVGIVINGTRGITQVGGIHDDGTLVLLAEARNLVPLSMSGIHTYWRWRSAAVEPYRRGCGHRRGRRRQSSQEPCEWHS